MKWPRSTKVMNLAYPRSIASSVYQKIFKKNNRQGASQEVFNVNVPSLTITLGVRRADNSRFHFYNLSLVNLYEVAGHGCPSSYLLRYSSSNASRPLRYDEAITGQKIRSDYL